MHGLDIIGLPSITHMRNKDTGSLHPGILKIIQTCRVRRVVWLVDGDCLDISKNLKEADGKDKDLYKRPNSFFESISKFKQLLDDYDVDKYFCHIDSDNIVNNFGQDIPQPTQEGESKRSLVKGLDDLMVALPNRIDDIVKDIKQVSRNSDYFQRFNITRSTLSALEHFHISDPKKFYLFHVERRPDLKDKQFNFRGTLYRYDEEKGECNVVVPGEASSYFRVGDQYYKYILKPNKYGQLERQFVSRQKGTIVEDHGRQFTNHISKYETFCNVPEHVNFHQVINSCFNVYSPLDFRPEEDEVSEQDCQTIIDYLKHIFGENSVWFTHPKTKKRHEYKNYQLALDYIQILFHHPAEKLPILCLVSKENNTGKSTFAKLLKQIFGGNVAIVGNQDLAGDFNSHWSTKLLVICDETKIDKQHVVEKVKSLSTADKIMMNAKGKDQVELDCFIKFMFITNNEENFIYATTEDIRYWVIKVPVLKEENPDILQNMIEEIPAFLGYLNKRKLATERLNRMWFHPYLLKTEALKRVVEFSMPQVVKEVRSKMRDLFFHTGEAEIFMSKTDILEDLLGRANKFEDYYLERAMREHLKLDQYHVFECNGKRFETFSGALLEAGEAFEARNELTALQYIKKKVLVKRYQYPKFDKTIDIQKKSSERIIVWVKAHGRPFVFRRSDFLTADEIENNEPDPELAMMAQERNAPEMNGHGFQPIEMPSTGELPF